MLFCSRRKLWAVSLCQSCRKTAWSKWLLSSASVQDELFPDPNSAGLRVSAKTRGCAEVIWGQVCRLSPAQEELTAMGQPPG